MDKDICVEKIGLVNSNDVEIGSNKTSLGKVNMLKIRTTIKFIKEKRKSDWAKDFGWVEGDVDRLIRSVEALPEDI